MTIEQKAREIALQAFDITDYSFPHGEEAARLGIIEGLEMAEQAVSKALAFGAKEAAVAAIRALIGETK